MDDDSLTKHPNIIKANSASSANIQSYVPLRQVIKGVGYRFTICKTSELSEATKSRIWSTFEKNMRTIIETSNVFPWDPPEKKKEMFHQHSRFLLILRDTSVSGNKEENIGIVDEDPIAYTIFRFERDEGRNVIYVYELQSSETARRLGLGRTIIHNLDSIGRAFGMSLILLTHLKDNKPAKAFYDSLGFDIDETSPDYEDDDEDDDCDEDSDADVEYSILSRRIDSI